MEGDTDNRPGYDGGDRITSIFGGGGGDTKPTYPPSEPYKPYRPYVPSPTINKPDPAPYVPPPTISKPDPEPYVPKIGGAATNDNDYGGVQLRST